MVPIPEPGYKTDIHEVVLLTDRVMWKPKVPPLSITEDQEAWMQIRPYEPILQATTEDPMNLRQQEEHMIRPVQQDNRKIIRQVITSQGSSINQITTTILIHVHVLHLLEIMTEAL